MRVQQMRDSAGQPVGYVMWLSAQDTYLWARRPGSAWPGSTTSGSRLVVDVDSNGLCGLTVDGKDDNGQIDANELDAIVTDHLPEHLRHLWPVWGSKRYDDNRVK